MSDALSFERDVADQLQQLFIKWGVAPDMAVYLKLLVMLFLVTSLALIADRVTRKFLRIAAAQFARKTKTQLDDIMIGNKVFTNIAHFVPLIILYESIPFVFADWPDFSALFIELIDVLIIFTVVVLVRSMLRSLSDFLKTQPSLKEKPIESFMQVFVIITYFLGFLFAFSEITGKSIWSFLTALGAASAILLLVFRDTILGFVGSLQLATNDMVRIGDWITMEKYGADGDVIEITLSTVKVRNFDNTITTIPTYNLISDSFKNWRGMQESGGRRIKRALNIKMSSIRFLTPEDVKRFERYELLHDYLQTRANAIAEYNTKKEVDESELINGRNLTNIGVFRKYMEEYASHHPAINKNLTMMSRQLQPTEKGIPIEIYMFSSDKRWVNYEYIMGDIFDHMLAAVHYFDLEVFELPTGNDLKGLIQQEGQ